MARPSWANALGVAVMVFLNGVGSSNVGLYTTPAFPVVGLWCFFSASPQDRWRFATTAFSRGATTPSCSVRFVGRDEAAGRAGTLRVVNEGQEAFGSVPTLFVVEDTPGGKTLFQRPRGLFRPGSAQLVGRLPGGRRLRAVVGPSADKPWCVETAQ